MLSTISAFNVAPITLGILDILKPTNQSRLLEHPEYTYNLHIRAINDNILFVDIHRYVVGLILIIFTIGFDTLYMNLAYHASALFAILG